MLQNYLCLIDIQFESHICVAARAIYANFTLSLVVTGKSFAIHPSVIQMKLMFCTITGVHLFMTVYGLSVFLETPESQRAGRKGYIAASIASVSFVGATYALLSTLISGNFFLSNLPFEVTGN